MATGLLLGAACSGQEAADPAAVLDAAAASFRDADSVHVEITSAGVPEGGGAALLSGTGDAQRPDAFTGTLRVRVLGQTADVDVLGTGGTLYAQLPFSSGLTEVDPVALGVPDPGELVARDGGVGRLVEAVVEPVAGEPVRADGEVLDVVTGQLQGELVADELLLADPSQPVDVSVQVVRESGELRVLELTGPFYDAAVDSTYTVTLTDYDVPVTVPPPPA